MVIPLLTTFWLAMSAQLDALVLDLQSPLTRIRTTAAEQLCRLGEGAREAAAPLATATGDEDQQVRDWATAALEELGPPQPSDAQRLAELLSDENPDRAYWAATLLGRLKDEASDSVEQLGKAIEDHSALEVRQRAAWALGKIGPAASRVTEVLQKASTSDDPRLARLAGRALDQIQP